MKINFGCGNSRFEGFLNVDRETAYNPDLAMDVEKFSWPIEDDSVEEVKLPHVLEHVGAEIGTHRRIIKELYRICRDGAEPIDIMY